MAVIGKIRERGTLLGIIVGGALLLFVVGDFIGNRGGNEQTVGVIAGTDVDLQHFSRLVEEQTDLYRQNGSTVNAQLQQQIRDNVWNEMLKDNILMEQARSAGFGGSISLPELDDIRFGNNIAPMFKNDKSIIDPATGQPDAERLRKGLKSLQERDFTQFSKLNAQLSTERIYAKYNTLVKKSCFVNSAQVKDDWTAKNTSADFEFVAQRYTSEPDSLYPVSETDLTRFYDMHKEERKWEQKPSRSFAYVRFNATPTAEDVEESRASLEGVKQEFAEAGDSKTDSALVMAYAETKNPMPTAYVAGTADAHNDSLILKADTGVVVGPFREGDSWKVVKVVELADVPEARVRHILFQTQGKSPGEDALIKQTADSVLKVVKNDRSKFEAMVAKYSEDPGSKSTGGVYEWFDRTRMVPEFTAASFDEKVGAITMVKTSYGYHIVEVLGQRTNKERRVLAIDRSIAPIQAMKLAWRKANEFALAQQDTASFRKSAEEQGLQYTPVDQFRPDQSFVPGLQSPGEVIAWVNHAKPDAKTSEPLTIDDGYVVATLLQIREEGMPKLEDVRERFTAEVRKEKKAEAVMAKMQGKTDLAALATELGVNVQNSGSMPYSTNTIPGGYSDVAVIGSIFAVKEGAFSAPLKGDLAVYMAKMVKLTPAGELPETATDPKPLTDRVRARAETMAFNALKEAADVKDYRSNFY